MGCSRGVLGTSTLHLFWDLFGILSKDRVAIFADAGIYPIARWALERAAAKGTPVKFFKHHDPVDLQRQLRRSLQSGIRYGRRPVAVSDGLCPGCGRAAPIREYLESIRRFGGQLILDDTQALGILGKSPIRDNPYGFGGGGSLQWNGVKGSDIVVVNSLAKGFGAPVAVLAGGNKFVRRFEDESDARVHCSPPSAAAIGAATRALDVNEIKGDELRDRLMQRVLRFRSQLKSKGLDAGGSMFPAQNLSSIPGLDVHEVHERMLKSNVRTVLKRSHLGTEAQLAFLITADHSPAQIDEAATILSETVRGVLNR